jgi:hypothetical protein
MGIAALSHTARAKETSLSAGQTTAVTVVANDDSIRCDSVVSHCCQQPNGPNGEGAREPAIELCLSGKVPLSLSLLLPCDDCPHQVLSSFHAGLSRLPSHDKAIDTGPTSATERAAMGKIPSDGKCAFFALSCPHVEPTYRLPTMRLCTLEYWKN